MGFLQVEQHSFVTAGNCFVAPVMLRCAIANSPSEFDKGSTMLAIAGENLRTAVAHAEQHGQKQSGYAPSIRPGPQLSTKRRLTDLGTEKQTKRWDNRENSVHAL